MATRACPDPARLRAHLDGALAASAEAEVVAHLDACASCRQALESLAAGSGSLLAFARQVGEGPTAAAPALPAVSRGPADGETEARPGGARALPAAPAVPPALAGHPRYRVLGPLGVGGMGAVFKAEHLLMERTVALKVIRHDLIDQPGAVERFRREVKAAAKLTHPNIVAAYDAERADDMHFLVMEYVEGASLARLVAEQGPLPTARACDYIRQAALGLQHAFEQGMVHRDIKPQNLMLTPGGQVKVLDFGLARFAQETQPAGALTQPLAATPIGAPAESLTKAGTVMGTPDYMAPEQIRDARAADIRADIYSLGCTLYALLAGCPPFPEGTMVQKAAAHLEETPRPLTALRRDVPPGLARVVARMMAKDPARRYQTPAEAVAALLPFTEAASVLRRRARRRLLGALAGLAFAAALTAGAVYLFRPARTVEQTADDSQRIQGAWKPVSGEASGRPVTEAALKGIFAVRFNADHVSWIMADGEALTGTFALDPGKNPKEIDVIRESEQAMVGLYILEGDALKICLGEPGARRPADFTTDPEGTRSLIVLRREPGLVAPPPPPDGSIRRFVGHESAVKSVAFSPDGLYALSGSGYPDRHDCSLRLWDVNTTAELRRYGRPVGPVMSVAFAPGDGRIVACAGADQTVRAFDRQGGQEVNRFTTPTQNFVNSLAISQDRKRLLTGGAGDNWARLWDIASGKEVQWFKGHKGIVNAVALSRDGRFVLTGGQDRTARIWEAATGQELHRLEGHAAMVEGVAFSPDSRQAATCGQDAAVLLWDVETGRQIGQFPGHVGGVLSVVFSPDGVRLLTGGSDGTVRLWEVRTRQELCHLTGHTATVWSVAFSPDGRRALSGSADRTLRLWQLPEPDQKAGPP